MSSKKAQNELKQGFQEFEEKDIVEQSLALVDIVKDLLETNQYHAAILSRIESKIDNNLWCPILKKEVV